LEHLKSPTNTAVASSQTMIFTGLRASHLAINFIIGTKTFDMGAYLEATNRQLPSGNLT
jgi:hypothetical protein